MSKKINRKELFELIWSKSWFVITDQFNLSRFRLLNICKDYRIPAPSNDWWTETTIKQISPKPELYVDDFCRDDTMIEIVSDREIRQKRINEIKEDIEESCKDYLTVPNRLFNPDQLIQNAKYSFEVNNPSETNRDKGSDRRQLSIHVTKKDLGRSLRILDTFIKLIKARGHSIEISYDEYKIHIGDEYYEFSIREKHKRIESKEKWQDHDLEPTGLLILSVGRYNKKEFTDSGVPLEQKLSMALAYLEYTAEVSKHSTELNEIQRKKREEEERVAKEIKDRETREIGRWNNLIKYAKAWNRAKLLRDYINAVELKSKEMNQVSENVQEWIKWAQTRVDDYDPLGNGFDKFLNEIVND